MQEPSANPPEENGRGERRARFPRRSGTTRTTENPRTALYSSLEELIDLRLDDGLRVIEEQAASLMREVAAEMWRASGSDTRPEQERLISLLSRDQAIRSLIASSDERFQALAVRGARLEDSMAEVANTSRAMRESMAESARTIHEAANSPMLEGVAAVRGQLEGVEERISGTMTFLEERERSLVDGIQQQIVAHGDLITKETSRIVEAMQGYVQGGVEAVGHLAQSVDAQIQAAGVGGSSADIASLEAIRASVAGEFAGFAGHLDQLYERIGLQGREMNQTAEGLREAMEQRVHGLALLVRSDSQALQGLIERMGMNQETALRESLDDGLAGMAAQTREAIVEHAGSTLERIDRMERIVGERVEGISDELTAAIDREMAMLADRIDAQLGGAFERMLETRSNEGSIERMDGDATERLERHVDDRLAALAKMIRADNRVIAERMAERTPEPMPADGGEAAKLALRAIKELQASLAGDVMGSMDRRFQSMGDQLHKETQSTAEAMVKVAEVMGQKIDRLSVRIDEGYGNDLQVVIDRMGDAIQAMSGRTPRTQPYDL